ncbi:hypothetical protein HMPREF0063_12875 [Aeromicrobium marinum DSM 15272]|uniref:Uncharacterized protein n=1 Tax=Aeromicrobium marinum DSM 15272 TaxID=585531 RepID=E2SFR6_9ACTN|nr:permease prefix domain 1-containing protein [Aeromicrobium marinum]EFQ81968.1 hypothetical protein HMPREF0063_12875 [Aeromicrobium marinum DSM 15272]
MTLPTRYVHAVTRAVPEDRRADVAAELGGSIADMVDDRVDQGQSRAAAERAVLTELGDPARLAATYTDRTLHLIGPTYYLVWWRLMLTLLAWVPATVGVVVAVIAGADASADAGDVISAFFGAFFQVGFQIAFWVTLGFALLDRFGGPDGLPGWTVDDLPEVPADSDVSLTDAVAAVVFPLLVVGALAWQQFLSPIGGDERIAVIDPDLWSSWLPLVVVLLLAESALMVAVYRNRRWTMGFAGINAVVAGAFAAVVVWLTTREELFNPAFVGELDWLGENLDLVSNVVVLVTVATMLADVATGYWRAFRSRSA